MFTSRYAESYALVVGINSYLTAGDLSHAANDARAVAECLKSEYGFADGNVRLLTDESATRDAIREAFYSFVADGTNPDDRVVFFFAGHGHTEESPRREIGFLVPHDGSTADLSSLVQWTDLTGIGELIQAKHLLFLVDACYGGLALTRAGKAGAKRFLASMMSRHARQAMSAGKANEVVSDSGGPRSGHSVFTGHLLDGLEGAAVDGDGVLTASSLMAHVYARVSRDHDSNQTPHCGHLDGDGDMVFVDPRPPEDTGEHSPDEEGILVKLPASAADSAEERMSTVEQAKDLLVGDLQRIRLLDLVADETRKVIALTSTETYPNDTPYTVEEFETRVTRYETDTAELVQIQALLAHWGSDLHSTTISLPVRRIAGAIPDLVGRDIWIATPWYPVGLLLYAGGIGAIAAGKYGNLLELLEAEVLDRNTGDNVTVVERFFSHGHPMSEAFKQIPGLERRRTPRSDHIYELLQPTLDDLFFLNEDYETLFDRFEVLVALHYASERFTGEGSVWGPPGRFAWKHGRQNSPLNQILSEARTKKDSWEPLAAGFFGGDLDRFLEIAQRYGKVVAESGWSF